MSIIKRIILEEYEIPYGESLIAAALDTPEGRTALAQAMTEPIRRSLDYQAIGRRLILVDELPQGALARYERDVASVAYVVHRRGSNLIRACLDLYVDN